MKDIHTIHGCLVGLYSLSYIIKTTTIRKKYHTWMVWDLFWNWLSLRWKASEKIWWNDRVQGKWAGYLDDLVEMLYNDVYRAYQLVQDFSQWSQVGYPPIRHCHRQNDECFDMFRRIGGFGIWPTGFPWNKEISLPIGYLIADKTLVVYVGPVKIALKNKVFWINNHLYLQL